MRNANSVFVAVCVLPIALSAGELEDETARLILQLKDAKAWEIERALERIREIGPEARAAKDAVYQLLFTEDFVFKASEALASIGPEAIPLIQQALRHQDPDIRSFGIMCAGDVGPLAEPLIPDLLKLIRDEESSYEALETLGKLRLRPATVVPALVRELMSVGDSKAYWAVGSLYEFGPRAEMAIPALAMAALFHPEVDVRRFALSALGQIDVKGDACLKVLKLAVADDGKEVSIGGWGTEVQQTAVEELLSLGPRAVVAAPTLIKLI